MLGQFCSLLMSRILPLVVIVVHLGACGGESHGNASVHDATGAVADDVVLAGSVGDGPVTGAIVEVWTSHGRLVRRLKSDNTASFSARIRVWRSSYPLLLKVRGGIDLVTGKEPDFQMLSVMLDRDARAVNINPFSTLIVRIAQSLPGGLSAANIGVATGLVTDRLGFGLDLNLVPDPINSPVTDTNAASLMKSSEAAGEMVRRTRDLLAAAGRETSGDAVLAAIAADLQDGLLDGQGAAGTDPRITAVAQVVSGQVLVEALTNTLQVGGQIATDVIDRAIMTTRSGSEAVTLTQQVRVTAGMLEQTRTALLAASVLDAGAGVAALESSVSDITPGVLPDEVAKILLPDASRLLDDALRLVSTAGNPQIAAVNALPQAGMADPGTNDTGNTDPVVTDTNPVNHAPVISGFPVGSVEAGTVYDFQPLASDADGDVLVFSIAGKPVWADFDTTSGRLSGIPVDSDAGTYSKIAITVSDGVETAALPLFDITVDPAPALSGSFTLDWTAPVARADGSPLPPGEIGGFRIHYGSTSGNYSHAIDINDASVHSATLTDLAPGTYHVVMTSYDTGGLESSYSAEIVKYAR